MSATGTTVVRGSREQPGSWTKVRVEGWVQGDPLAAVAALLAPEIRALVLPDTAPAPNVLLDGLAVFEDVSLING